MKKKLVILGAAAMVAAVAVPVFALENEFHGMYRFREITSNFQNAGLSGAAGAYGGTSLLNADSTRSFTVFEQRARLQYIAKASDDLKLVTHFEIDSSWGDASFDNGRGKGGAIAADTVNLETKNVYLDFNLPSTKVNVKVGIQGFADNYKGVFLNDDVGAIVVKNQFDALTATGAFMRTYDSGTNGTGAGSNSPLGKQNVDIYLLDGKFAVNKDLSVGATYFLVDNDMSQSSRYLHMLGLNGAVKVGMLDLDAFGLYQNGYEIYTVGQTQATPNIGARAKKVEAYAAQLAAKANLGTAGTFRAAGLYASGNNNNNTTTSGAFQNVFDTNTSAGANAVGGSSCAGQYYAADMKILLRNVVAMDSDNALVGSLNNGNQGLLAGFLGYDAKINDKLSATANVGMAWIDKKNSTSVPASARRQGNDLGTELNAQVNYALYPSLTASLQGAYVILGKYFDNQGNTAKTQSAANPYLAGVMLNYGF
jgi:hypothetical protein